MPPIAALSSPDPVKNPGTREHAHTRDRARDPVALVQAAGHPPPVERLLLAVAAQWPALVAGGWVDVGEAWGRTASEWTGERVERALEALARMERPPTPGQLLAASQPPRGPARADGERPPHPRELAMRKADELRGEALIAGAPYEVLRDPRAAAEWLAERGLGADAGERAAEG